MTLLKIFAALRLKKILKRYLIAHGINTIAEFKKAIADRKDIIDIIAKEIKSKKKIEQLKAYLRLNEISKNFELNKELIKNHFTTYHHIARIPLFDFQNRFIDKASKNELKEIYYRAQQNLARDITVDSLETLIPQRSPLDYLITKSSPPSTSNSETENQEE